MIVNIESPCMIAPKLKVSNPDVNNIAHGLCHFLGTPCGKEVLETKKVRGVGWNLGVRVSSEGRMNPFPPLRKAMSRESDFT